MYSSIKGAESKLVEISNSSDPEQIKDLLTEVKFALIFSYLKFNVEVEPLSNAKGISVNPDLKIAKGDCSSFVDVKRFRPPHEFSPGQRLQMLTENIPDNYQLPIYGDADRDLQKIYNEIEKKFRQIDANGIIAIWNSNDELSPFEFGTAANYHRRSFEEDSRCSFILVRGEPFEQMSCFRLSNNFSCQLSWLSEFEQDIPDKILLELVT